jgi:glutaredoxin
MDILIYSKPTCKYCILSKNLLNDIDLPFSEHILNPDDVDYITRRDILFENYHKSFPIIIINDIFIGGYSELYKLYISGKLIDDDDYF